MPDPSSECRSWRNAAALLGQHPQALVALLGAPLAERALTPGRCDLAPAALRRALGRMSCYDLETGADLEALGGVHDAGDLALKLVSPAEAFAPIRDAVGALLARHSLVILAGGHNAITRPGVHGMGVPLVRAGLVTLDAHFDLRDTDCGLTNGNPVQALLEDGLPGANIVQIGLQPFANSRRMHEKARAAGIAVHPIGTCRRDGLAWSVAQALDQLAGRCEAILVDFDIDVIDRAHMPAAPGARPGGASVEEFFIAARLAGAHPKVRAIDLTEFDPSLDVGEVGALTAGRWAVEALAGVLTRLSS